MTNSAKNDRLNIMMETLNLSAASLSRIAHVEASLINKWRKGTRQITNRSIALIAVSEALIKLDKEKQLLKYYLPYQEDNTPNVEALVSYLLGQGATELIPSPTMDNVPKSGMYQMQYTVCLGKKGFRKAALAMLDYVLLLPPGQTIVILCRGRYDWIVKDISFVIQFVSKLQKVLAHNGRMLVIGRKGYTHGDVKLFAIPWLVAHMHGSIRSLYYEGDLKDDLRFVASIGEYWCARAVEKPLVEDNLHLRMCTDPFETEKEAAVCDAFLKKSKASSQYSFLSIPQGNEDNEKLWQKGPLPAVDKGTLPNGSFNAFCKIPGLGIITKREFVEILKANAVKELPDIPDYLFASEEGFSNFSNKIILCREDIIESLSAKEIEHGVISMLLGKRASVQKKIIEDSLKRLLIAMEQNENFQVALMPRVAFNKLRLEMLCFKDSVTVGWLQDGTESVLSVDNNSTSFYESINYVWDKSLQGWKRKPVVMKNLRKWLSGKGLNEITENSAIVQNWHINL